MAPQSLSTGTLVLIVVVFVWAMVRRMRLAIGRQLLQVRPLQIRAVSLGVAALLLMATAAHHHLVLAAELVGVIAGCGLAIISLRLTRFEATDNQRYYRPNVYLGVSLVVLFIVRIGYRFMLYRAGALDGNAAAGSRAAFGSSPLTGSLMLATLAYYVYYYAGLLREAAKPIEAAAAT